MRDESFTMQSKLDGLTRQYSTDNYDDPVDMLISMSLNRNIKIKKKMKNGAIRVYKARTPFSIFNSGDAFRQDLSKGDFMIFDKNTMRFLKGNLRYI